MIAKMRISFIGSHLSIRRLRHLITVMIFLSITGCEEDYGDRAKAFVRDKVSNLSKQYVSAILPVKWSVATTEYLTDLGTKLKATLEYLPDLPVIDKPIETLPLNEALALFRAIDRSIGIIDLLSGANEEIQEDLFKLDALCSDWNKFVVLGIPQTAIEGFVSTISSNLPSEQEQYYEVSWSSGENGRNEKSDMGKTFSSLFTSAKIAEQNDRLREAKADIPKYVMQPDAIFKESQQVCQQAIITAKEWRDQIGSDTHSLEKSLDDRRSVLVSLELIVAVRLRGLEINKQLEDGGADIVLSDIERAILAGRVGLDSSLMVNQLLAIKKFVIDGKHSCKSRMQMAEHFEDAVLELSQQYSVLKDILPRTSFKTIRKDAQRVSLEQRDLPQIWKNLKAKKC